MKSPRRLLLSHCHINFNINSCSKNVTGNLEDAQSDDKLKRKQTFLNYFSGIFINFSAFEINFPSAELSSLLNWKSFFYLFMMFRPAHLTHLFCYHPQKMLFKFSLNPVYREKTAGGKFLTSNTEGVWGEKLINFNLQRINHER